MKALKDLNPQGISILFTDIDDTMTQDGILPSESYKALWSLQSQGISVIPVTGRPAGWCEMIARMWPVPAVIGENGGFYFSYCRESKKMKRFFWQDESQLQENRKKLDQLSKEILQTVPGSALASDQFCRIIDLAIDFCEDVPPLTQEQIQKIVSLFQQAGAQAKVSSIHVNGWFGDHDKLKMCQKFIEEELKIKWENKDQSCAFIGDSPNDEPMFGAFKNSVGVANIKNFSDSLKHPPKFVTEKFCSEGFCELAELLITS